MYFKKFGKTIFGVELNAAERKAMDKEIQKELAEFTKQHFAEIDAIFLWQLHKQFGFGPKRLKRFYDEFVPAIRELVDRYEMDSTDQLWLATRELKEYGIDIEEWRKEK